MIIGNLKLKSNILLAPMSGVTDYPYREIVKKFSPGLVFSEMIASRALIRKNKKTLNMIKRDSSEYYAIQIAGCDPLIMSEAANKVIGCQIQVDTQIIRSQFIQDKDHQPRWEKLYEKLLAAKEVS